MQEANPELHRIFSLPGLPGFLEAMLGLNVSPDLVGGRH